MKRLFLLSAFACGAFAQGQHPSQVIGTVGVPVTGQTITFAVSPTSWAAFSWVPLENHTTADFRFMVNSVTGGSLAPGDLQVDIYSDSSGLPGSALGSGCTTSTVTTVPTGALFTEVTGLTCPMTALTQYWFVVKNNNPSVTLTMRYGAPSTGAPSELSSSASTFGSLMVSTTTNSGATWAILGSSLAFIRVRYNDSGNITYAGNPLTAFGPTDSAHQVYNGHESGTVFTTGAIGYKVRGILMPCGKQGSPTGNLQIKLYQGSSGSLTLLGTSNNLGQSYFGTAASSACKFYFPAPVALAPNATFRFAMSNTGTDSATVYYKSYPTAFDNDPNSKALLPFGGSLQQQYCSGTCTVAANWSNVTGQYLPFALILDAAGEYVVPTSGTSGPTGFFYVQ